MKHFKIIVLFVFAASLIGCTSTTRYVTNQTWVTDDAFLISYAEYTKTFITSETEIHTELCTIQPSNAVVCEKQPHIDKLLNPHLEEKYASVKQPTAPAPASAPAQTEVPDVAPDPGADAAPATEPTKEKKK